MKSDTMLKLRDWQNEGASIWIEARAIDAIQSLPAFEGLGELAITARTKISTNNGGIFLVTNPASEVADMKKSALDSSHAQ